MRVVIKQRNRAEVRLKAISYSAALKATEEQAEAGTDNTRYMTALRTTQQITGRLSDQATAEAGADNFDLMTPLRTKQSVVANAKTGAWVQSGTGASPTTIDAKLKEFVSLEDFGATGGDVVKDTDALQKAITAGLPVLLGFKEYLIAPIDFTSSVVIFGRGPKSILKWQNGGSAESLFDFITNVMDVEFRDLVIDGNQQNYTDTSGYFAAIDFKAPAGSSLTLDGVMFKNGRIVDVRVPGPTAGGDFVDFTMANCRFKDGFVGTSARSAVFVQCQDNVRASWVGNSAMQSALPSSYGRAGFIFQRGTGSPSTSYGTVVGTGNRFFNVGRGTLDTLGCLDVYSGARAVSFAGNTMENVPGRGISVKGDQSSIAITGNTVRNTLAVTGASSGVTPIVLFQDLFNSDVDRDLNISGNTITSSEGYGIFLDGEGLSSSRYRNALIHGNVISGVAVDGIRARFIHGPSIRDNKIDGCSANGVALIDADDHGIIDNNDIQNVGVHAVVCNTSISDVDLSICGNRIRGLLGGSSRGVSIEAAAKSYQINDNNIEGGTTGIVTTGSTALSSIRRNRITSSATLTRSGTDTLLTYGDNIVSTAIGFAARTLTIASGAITAWADWHYVDTEGSTSTDDLDTINGGIEGRILRIRAANSSRDVVLKTGTGNLRMNSDRTLDNAVDLVTLLYSGGVWLEVAFANNGA